MPKLVRFQHKSDFIIDVAALIQEKILETYNEFGLVRIALSGGNTPLPVYEALAASTDIPWERVDIYQVDERMIPADNLNSNQFSIKEKFKFRLNELHEFYSIDTTLNSFESAKKYNLEIENIDSGQDPIFDLVILGMGQDGHTASLFPNTKSLKEEELFVVNQNVPNLEFPERVSLTYKTILNSATVFVLIQGEDKMTTLDKVLGHESNFENFPIRKIIDEHSDLSFFILTESN